MVEHVHVGDSPSAHLVACSLWLQKDNPCRRGLKCNVVLFGLVDV